MYKALAFGTLLVGALGQYAPQQQAAPQGLPFSYSNSVTHSAPSPAAAAPAYGASQAPSFAAPQAPRYAAPQAPSYAGAQGFGNINQLAAQNPAFNIQVPQGYEQPAAYGGAPQPAPASFAPQQGYAAPQAGAPAGNPYGGPFQYSSSVTHTAPAPASQATHGAPQAGR